MKPATCNRRPEALLCVVLALATAVVYWPVHTFKFLNFDDPAYVTSNPHVFHGLSRQSIIWAFKTFQAANWHPVALLSHMLDCQLFGHEAGLHHLMNLLFHTANTLLLFRLFQRLTGAVFRSALVAALFALHPLHVESVAWIAERKDVLASFFGLLALNTYVRYAAPSAGGRPKTTKWHCLTLILFAFSLMSKPMLVTFPFLLLLIDFWPLKRLHISDLRRLLLEKLPFFLLSVADCVITLIAQKSAEAVVDTARLPIGERLANAVMAYAWYLRKMIWPSDLAAYYPYRLHVPPGEVALALIVLFLVSALSLRLARRLPYLLFGWLWYLGMLVPVIGLVQVGGQSMADRYTYLPLVGIFVMCAWGAADLLPEFRYRRLIAGFATAVVLGACAGDTWLEESYWRDSETLFRRDLELVPENNVMARHCLGRALFDRGADAEARAHFEEALRLVPDFAPGHLDLADCLTRQGHYAEAMFHYQAALRLKPKDPEIYKCLGASLAAQMRLEEASTNFLIAIQFQPDYTEAYTKLGSAEMALGKTNEGLKHLTAAVAIYPDYPEAQYYLGHALADRREFDEAADHYRAAIKVNPYYVEAMNDLAWMGVTQGNSGRVNLPEAARLAQRACELTQYRDATYLETLAAVFSETGQFPKAIETVEKAIAAAAGDREIATKLQKQLVSYRGGRSYSGRTNP